MKAVIQLLVLSLIGFASASQDTENNWFTCEINISIKFLPAHNKIEPLSTTSSSPCVAPAAIKVWYEKVGNDTPLCKCRDNKEPGKKITDLLSFSEFKTVKYVYLVKQDFTCEGDRKGVYKGESGKKDVY